MNPVPDQHLESLLSAYLDGELDAVAAADVEQRLAHDRTAAAAFARLSALRQRLRSVRDDDVPSRALAGRIETAIGLSQPATEPTRWAAMAAAVVIGALLGATASMGLFQVGPRLGGAPVADQIVANNLRALMAADPVQVASSDHHTVKPWFDGKLTFAADVVDLADKGFPLVGGRVDIVDFMPVASLVYRYNQHLITVTEIPSGAALAAPAAIRGFVVRAWQAGPLAYWVVSDASADELDTFVRLFRAAGA